jgi:acyl carrier protein
VDDSEILAGIAAVARRHLDHDGPLEPSMRLVEDLELDSIRLLTLAVEVENRFRICLDEDDDRAIETVGDLVAVVRRELRGAAPAPAVGPPA